MIYETRLTIPRNTPPQAPASVVLPVHPGIVRQVEVAFPSGCVGLVYARVTYWERVIWPANPDGAFSGDGVNLVWPEDLELIEPPFEFELQGWNLDDTFEHTVTLRIQIVPVEKDIRRLIAALVPGASGPRRPVEG